MRGEEAAEAGVLAVVVEPRLSRRRCRPELARVRLVRAPVALRPRERRQESDADDERLPERRLPRELRHRILDLLRADAFRRARRRLRIVGRLRRVLRVRVRAERKADVDDDDRDHEHLVEAERKSEAVLARDGEARPHPEQALRHQQPRANQIRPLKIQPRKSLLRHLHDSFAENVGKDGEATAPDEANVEDGPHALEDGCEAHQPRGANPGDEAQACVDRRCDGEPWEEVLLLGRHRGLLEHAQEHREEVGPERHARAQHRQAAGQDDRHVKMDEHEPKFAAREKHGSVQGCDCVDGAHGRHPEDDGDEPRWDDVKRKDCVRRREVDDNLQHRNDGHRPEQAPAAACEPLLPELDFPRDVDVPRIAAHELAREVAVKDEDYGEDEWDAEQEPEEEELHRGGRLGVLLAADVFERAKLLRGRAVERPEVARDVHLAPLRRAPVPVRAPALDNAHLHAVLRVAVDGVAEPEARERRVRAVRFDQGRDEAAAILAVRLAAKERGAVVLLLKEVPKVEGAAVLGFERGFRVGSLRVGAVPVPEPVRDPVHGGVPASGGALQRLELVRDAPVSRHVRCANHLPVLQARVARLVLVRGRRDGVLLRVAHG
mmetsp:Transcript_26669/g.87440  ORF Transcript_26669/g.87440 Transcript_26669/m.87440 type:complete len:606 (+) Transcript_26669:211-2028(+)